MRIRYEGQELGVIFYCLICLSHLIHNLFKTVTGNTNVGEE